MHKRGIQVEVEKGRPDDSLVGDFPDFSATRGTD
jgi:hypothetical protein